MGPANVTRPLIVSAVFSLWAGMALAESGQFTASLAGIKAGSIAYSATETGGRYRVQGAARAGGLAGAFFDFSMEASAQGAVQGNRYRPEIYELTGQDGGKFRTTRFRYRKGAPEVSQEPKRSASAHGANPAAQAGTLDPMTVIYAMLRDRPKDLMCKLNADFFDGQRRANIRYVRLTPLKGGKYLCEGEYRRLQGFSPKEMREKSYWPVSVFYAPLSDGRYRVSELRFHTNFGAVRLGRR